jgi:hypothetical protein
MLGARVMLEKHVESKVCEYAKTKGLLVYKFTSPAKRSVPDRLFVLPDGRMFFCEFKREGATPTVQQSREHLRLRQQKVSVFVIDNVEDGKAMVDLMMLGVKRG